MKSTNFNFNGGFPFDQSTLKRLQDGFFELIRTYALQSGCQDVGNYILYGCDISGANITPGAMFIDGEVCPFAGAIGTNATKIKKQTNTTNAPFENGTNPPVFIETLAVVNATGTALSDFTRFFYVSDANYVHTDVNFTALLLAKLNSISSEAEVNVQSDYNVTDPLSDAYIKNMPEIVAPLFRGEATGLSMATGGTSTAIEVAFPSVGTADYIVLGNLKSATGSFQNGISYSLFSYTESSFIIRLKSDIVLGYSNLTFQFVLMPKP